jgi:hypothetical protein
MDSASRSTNFSEKPSESGRDTSVSNCQHSSSTLTGTKALTTGHGHLDLEKVRQRLIPSSVSSCKEQDDEQNQQQRAYSSARPGDDHPDAFHVSRPRVEEDGGHSDRVRNERKICARK